MPERTGAALRGYLALSRMLPLVAPAVLRRRAARGKEIAQRVQEKLGQPTSPRPQGRLVWLHAVGLGEVLALRGLIAAMAARDAGLEFLVTSTARSSAEVMQANLPDRTRHQFMPIDAPQYMSRFLDHWRPDLSVWAEQDIWPGAVVAVARRGIPLALVNARMTEEGCIRRARFGGLYADLFARFALMGAQDEATARRLERLGAQGVRVTGSLKPSAPVLHADAQELARARTACAGRRVWIAASSHPGDEDAAFAAQAALFADDPAWLLVVVPRRIERADGLADALRARGLGFARRSSGGVPAATDAVWLGDTFGELGVWYRLAARALVGGGFDAVGGHNPWEAVALQNSVFHGADTRNFAADYAALDAAGASRIVTRDGLADALRADPADMIAAGQESLIAARQSVEPMAEALVALMGAR